MIKKDRFYINFHKNEICEDLLFIMSWNIAHSIFKIYIKKIFKELHPDIISM